MIYPCVNTYCFSRAFPGPLFKSRFKDKVSVKLFSLQLLVFKLLFEASKTRLFVCNDGYSPCSSKKVT